MMANLWTFHANAKYLEKYSEEQIEAHLNIEKSLDSIL